MNTSDIHFRSAVIVRDGIDTAARTVRLSFSSDIDLDRGDYIETLDHSPGAADLSRLSAFLLDHDPQKLLGKVESATIAGGRGKAVVRFAKNPLAQEVWTDVADGCRDQISVGYRLLKVARATKDGKPHIIARKWSATEISVVGVGEDFTVGIGRSAKLSTKPNMTTDTTTAATEPEKTNEQQIAEAAKAFADCGRPVPDVAARCIGENVEVGVFRTRAIEWLKSHQAQRGQPTASGRFEVGNDRRTRSISAELLNDPGFQKFARSGSRNARFSMEFPDVTNARATLLLSGSSLTNSQTLPIIAEQPTQRLTVADLFTQTTTTAGSVNYPRETTHTPAADMVTEGVAKPEVTITLENKTATVEVVAGWVKVSTQMLSDIPAAQSFINMRLRNDVELKEESQLLNGDGTTPQILGIYNTPDVQTQAVGVLSLHGAALKAMTKIRLNGLSEPSAWVMHPNDFEQLMALTDANGQLLSQVPALTELGDHLKVPALWGKPIVVSPSALENTVLCGDFRTASLLVRRAGITIEADRVEDDFILNLVTILCETRLTLTTMSPQKYCLVTSW